ncbi:MAG: hypothetical protein DMF84_09280 [Acidobacteria bacterium]|nr:MAG: hypothetical protein DMF84_09280 [Acidobacteriota bacterium]
MDLRTFIAALVASLAWPLTALIGLLLVRKIIASLVPLVRTLKYSDIEVSFGREVTETRNAADAAAIKPVSETSRPQRWDDLIRLASVRPRSAIRNAWRHIEETLAREAKARNLQIADGVWSMPMVLGSILLNAGVISDAQYSLLNRLRRLVTEAERAPVDSLSADDAADFVTLALRLAESIGEGPGV